MRDDLGMCFGQVILLARVGFDWDEIQGVADKVREVNRAGAALARRAVGDTILVAGAHTRAAGPPTATEQETASIATTRIDMMALCGRQ